MLQTQKQWEEKESVCKCVCVCVRVCVLWMKEWRNGKEEETEEGKQWTEEDEQ